MEIRPDTICYCGSGKRYGDCCLIEKDATVQPESKPKETIQRKQSYETIAREVHIASIKNLIEGFGNKYLTTEYINYAFNLCDKISLTSDLDIFRGQKAIWAAAIIHVIARLNSLFDSKGEIVITPALICSHFDTVKSTVGNRAAQVQNVCIKPGAKGYCRQKDEDKTENPAEHILEHRRLPSQQIEEKRAWYEGKQGEPAGNPQYSKKQKQMKLFDD